MDKKSMVKIVSSTTAVLIFFIICPYAQGQIGNERPNFIIVMTDDQGYGDVGYNGNDEVKTPHLDDLAQSGLRLDRFYTAPVCSPTRAAVLTGRYPTRAGVFSWGHALRPQEKSMAKILRNSGYQTGFFGKYHLGSIRADGATSPGAHGFDTWYAAPNFYENDPWMSKNGQPVQLKGESSDVTVEIALEYIEEAIKEEAPFLVFIWLGSPHLPHEALEELKELYPDQPENMKNYYGEITGIDRAVGKLRNQLKKMNVSEETLLWFSSDNGGKFPEGNNGILREEKGTLWEGGISVPALIEWPGSIQPAVSDIPTGAVDIFPTILELAGLDLARISYPLDGMSLVPLFKGYMNQREKPLGFWNYPEIKGQGMKSDQIVQEYQKVLEGEMSEELLNEGLLNSPDQEYTGLDQYPYSGSFAWIENEWKLHQREETFELYNLEKDTKEENNLADEFPQRVKSMGKALRQWQDSVVKSIRGEDY
jgi:arylsulfatase A-like enzyme